MVCGMSPEQFWYGDPYLAPAYIEAFKIRRENERWDMWWQGLHHARAVSCCFSEDASYPEEPLQVIAEREADEERRAQHAMEVNKARFLAMAEVLNASRRERAEEGNDQLGGANAE